MTGNQAVPCSWQHAKRVVPCSWQATFGLVLFCHGSPHDDEAVVLVDSRSERWQGVLAELSPEVRTVVRGHTHMPFLRLVDRRLVIKSGSIGMPYGRPGGSWAPMRDGAVTLHRTPVDLDRAVARVVAESSYPDRSVSQVCNPDALRTLAGSGE